MSKVQPRVPPALRMIVGIVFILLSVPSLTAPAVMWKWGVVDDRVLAVALAGLGCWAIYDGARGLLKARKA